MRRLTDAEMHDVYDVARLANELVEGYDYLLSVVQAAEPHALADVAALREEASALRAENERLHSRVAELEGAAANWALVEAMPAGASLVHAGSPGVWAAYVPTGTERKYAYDPAAALRAALGKAEGE